MTQKNAKPAPPPRRAATTTKTTTKTTKAKAALRAKAARAKAAIAARPDRRPTSALLDTLAGVVRIAETEGDFQQAVIELATVLHWKVYHTHNSQHSPAGFPDLMLVRDGAVIAAECKREHGGHLSTAQHEWLAAFAACPGVLSALWHPSAWDAIYTVLSLSAAAVLGLAADQAIETAQAAAQARLAHATGAKAKAKATKATPA